MNKDDFRNMVPETPQHFVQRMDETLERIETMNKKVVYRSGRIALICAVLIVVLVGSAFAAAKYGVFDFMINLHPIEGAEKLVKTNLGTIENEYFRMELEEAVYDGFGGIVQLRYTDKTEAYAIKPSAYDDYTDPMYIWVEEVYEDGSSSGYPAGRKDGKRVISLSSDVVITDENGKKIEFNSYDAFRDSDGSYVVRTEGFSSERMSDQAVISITHNAGIYNEDMTKREKLEVKELVAKIDCAEKQRKVKLIPDEGFSQDDFEIVEAYAEFTPLRAYLTVNYRYTESEDAPFGVTVTVYDANGNRIETGDGEWNRIPSESGEELYSEVQEMQSLETIPEKLVLRIKVIGEDKYIAEIPVKVTEGK